MRVGGELADLGGRATHFQMAPPTGSEDSSKTYFLQLPVKRAEVAPLATWQLAKEPLPLGRLTSHLCSQEHCQDQPQASLGAH